MSSNASLMMWAQRICSKRGAAPHLLLEIKENATAEEAQTAFHKIARLAHPDLHRNTLSAEELELLTTAYALIAGAYQSFKSQAAPTQSIKPAKVERVAVTPSGPAPASGATQQMSSKAMVYYRKAELALKRGDLRAAVLQIKLAIAADPQSGFLRTALAEVEAEMNKPSE